jgi:hypothetical protein
MAVEGRTREEEIERSSFSTLSRSCSRRSPASRA